MKSYTLLVNEVMTSLTPLRGGQLDHLWHSPPNPSGQRLEALELLRSRTRELLPHFLTEISIGGPYPEAELVRRGFTIEALEAFREAAVQAYREFRCATEPNTTCTPDYVHKFKTFLAILRQNSAQETSIQTLHYTRRTYKWTVAIGIMTVVLLSLGFYTTWYVYTDHQKVERIR